jgi:hypothetical protein
MSYKNTVLADYPIAYWKLDETAISAINDYSELLEVYDSYSEVESLLPSYNYLLYPVANDYSGYNNNAIYNGAPENGLLTLIPGNFVSSKVNNQQHVYYFATKDYTGTTAPGGFATVYTSDNDFTLEGWIYPSFTTNNKTAIFADTTENIGIFYQNGNITFAVDSNEVTYTVPYLKKVLYIVATYTGDAISLYIDGKLVINKTISSFTFTNTSLSLKSGPTLSANDYFLVNSFAIYRYALNATQIESHYNAAQIIPSIQIAAPDQGKIFEIYDTNIATQFKYSYPANKPWVNFLNEDLYYNENEDALEILQTETSTSKTVVIDEFITIPLGPDMDSSKIEWDGSNGITVHTSLDGTTYTQCTNNMPIPGYKLNSFSSNRILYLRITMTTADASKYLPRLDSLSITFYNNQLVYSSNSPSYIYTLEGESNVSNYDIAFGNKIYPILSRDDRNGIKMAQDSGFNLITNKLIKTIEFFYTPDALTDSKLVSSLADTTYFASNYSWRNTGTISKTNISAIYVNGLNKTSKTAVADVFKAKELHHVVIVFSDPISDEIRFNHSLYGSVPALYQNITLYETQFNSTKAVQHYNLYTGDSATVLNDSSLTMTENAVEYYNNDWLVVQNS